MTERKQIDVDMRGKLSQKALDALMLSLTAQDAAHAFEPLIVDGVKARRERNAPTDAIVVLLDPYARGSNQTAMQVSGLRREEVCDPASPVPVEFKDLVSQAKGGGPVPFMLAKKGQDPAAAIDGFVIGWVHMDTGNVEVIDGANGAPCDLATTSLEEILKAFSDSLAATLRSDPTAHVAFVMVDRSKRKARSGWLKREEIQTIDMGLPDAVKKDLSGDAPHGFGWGVACEEAHDGAPDARMIVGLVMKTPVSWDDSLAQITITMVPALALRLKEGAEVAVLSVDRENESIQVEGMTSAAAVAWLRERIENPEAPQDDGETAALLEELERQLARRSECPGLGVVLAIQSHARHKGEQFGLVGWASPEPVADPKQREAMLAAVHSDGREWKDRSHPSVAR